MLSLYKTKQSFDSYDYTINLISMLFFFYNFNRPHLSFNELTPAQIVVLSLTDKDNKISSYSLVLFILA